MEPESDAKRFKGDEDNDSDMEEDGDFETKDKFGIQDGIEPDTKGQSDAVETEKKAAVVRAGKSLEERQKEFQEMLLERGVCVLCVYTPFYIWA